MTDLTTKKASTFMVVLAFATVYIVWGSTYFFIQKAVQGFPPFLLGAIRFLIAGILLMGWSIIRREEIIVKKNIKNAVIGGVLMLFIGNGAVIWVEQYMASGVVAILLSSSPIWFVLLDKPKWKENLANKFTITGLVIGFAGVILLFSEKISSTFSSDQIKMELAGMGLLILGSIAWAGGSLYSKYNSTSGSAAVNTAWQMLGAGIAFLPGSIFTGELQGLQWENISTDAWLSLLYLIFFGSIAGFSAYVWLLQVRPATQVSTYAYVNPVVAVLLGVFLANEKISFLQIAGLVIILGSVLTLNLAKHPSNEHLAERKAVSGNDTVPNKSLVKKSSGKELEQLKV
jgi:drug/metabolite transporter (DMT)-like permease